MSKLAEKIKIHRSFWEGEIDNLIFIDYGEIAKYETVDYEKLFYNPELMLESEIERAKPVIDWSTDGIPALRANLGTIFIPAIAGQEYKIRDNQMPWTGEALEYSEILEVSGADILNAEIYQLAKRFYDLAKPRGVDSQYLLYQPDTQGVFDILHLLYGNDIFIEMAEEDKNEKVKNCLKACLELYVNVTKEIKKIIGEDHESMFHGHGTPQGLFFPHTGTRISEDTATLLSPKMIDEFIIPIIEESIKPFGSGFVHFCGHHKYFYESVCDLEVVDAVDLGNPEMYDAEWLLDICANTNTVFFGKIASFEGEDWESYLTRVKRIIKKTGAKCVLRSDIIPDNFKQAEDMYRFWHL
jgi:hypothetical protein